MITVIANEELVASLVNEAFREMLHDYRLEQKGFRPAVRRDPYDILRQTREEARLMYEYGDIDAFEATIAFYSDYFKDVYGHRPHGWLDFEPWYHGSPWWKDYAKRHYPGLYK